MADEKSVDKNFYLPAAILIAAFVIGGSLVYSANMQKGGTGNLVNPPVVEGSRVEFTITQSDHIRGNPNAEVTLVEFSDLECPFCKAFHPTAQQALDEYGDKVRWVYKHFP
ncbi:MAG: thioredoxin domain-containing protein, partial [Candidatus Wildermuthbacteria bacterium]|nr:thioredoxin domain-containing protein [Candidatus Wildermuthbacteria bacterium]